LVVKIGLLLDSLLVPVWQQRVILQVKSNSAFDLSLVVLNRSEKESSSGLIYRLFRKLDRTIFPSKHDCFHRVDVTDLLKGVKFMNVTPKQSRYTDTIASEEVNSIKEAKLDVLIRFGFRILTGEILTAARFGVWSLHHGDNAINRGGPPAFWEVVKGEPVTGVTLQVLSDELDGGRLIDKAFIRTDRTSFNRNQNTLYWAGVELLCNALSQFSQQHILPSPKGEWRGVRGFYSHPFYRNPNNLATIEIIASFLWRRIREVVSGFMHRPQWFIYYSLRGRKSDFHSGQPDIEIEKSLHRYKKLTPPSGVDWADPFVVKKDDKYYLFFEELDPSDRSKRSDGLVAAHISCLEFDEKGKQLSSKPFIVLKEQHHLSYPFIVEFKNAYYMIPEAAESKSVWMYRCEQFPYKWTKHHEMLKGFSVYDPTIHFYNGVWYLFGTQKPFAANSPDQYLHIYYSKELLGDWKPHAMNPVTRDVRGSRPAGRIFEREGVLIRPSQVGAPKYGYGIRFSRITKLTPTEFEEEFQEEILPLWKAGLRATHTFNEADGFCVVDVQE
jgi:folate-dependent phosphoribosylglycinamide formyltransferase PurN